MDSQNKMHRNTKWIATHQPLNRSHGNEACGSDRYGQYRKNGIYIEKIFRIVFTLNNADRYNEYKTRWEGKRYMAINRQMTRGFAKLSKQGYRYRIWKRRTKITKYVHAHLYK